MKILNLLLPLLCTLSIHTKVIEIDGKQDLENKLKNNPHAVIKFSRPGCPACKRIEQHYNRLSDKIKNVTFFAINTDKPKNKQVYPQWGVNGVPALFFVKNGQRSKEIRRKGDFAKSFEQEIRAHFGA